MSHQKIMIVSWWVTSLPHDCCPGWLSARCNVQMIQQLMNHARVEAVAGQKWSPYMLPGYMKSKYKGNSFPLATVKMQNSWCCHAGDVKYKTRAAANAWWQEGLLYTFEKHCRQDASTHAYITSKRDDHFFCFSICSYITYNWIHHI